VVVAASIIISLGFGPVFGLTTELIVGSAPPERAGAASGISETASELGGALGISILGSVGVALYRGELLESLPAGVPAEAAAVARDTLGGAVGVATELPSHVAAALLDVARHAFVDGMVVAALISLVFAVVVAVLAMTFLRNIDAGGQAETAPDPDPQHLAGEGDRGPVLQPGVSLPEAQ